MLGLTDTQTITRYWIPGIEHFTLRLRHGVAGQGVDVSGQNVGPDRMKGRLLDRKGDAITVASSDDNFNPGTEFSAQFGDQITVAEILSAAEIDLDARRSDPADASRTSTIRWDGINVVIYIQYGIANASVGCLANVCCRFYRYGLKPFTSTIIYDYKPRILSDLEYKVCPHDSRKVQKYVIDMVTS